MLGTLGAHVLMEKEKKNKCHCMISLNLTHTPLTIDQCFHESVISEPNGKECRPQ